MHDLTGKNNIIMCSMLSTLFQFAWLDSGQFKCTSITSPVDNSCSNVCFLPNNACWKVEPMLTINVGGHMEVSFQTQYKINRDNIIIINK